MRIVGRALGKIGRLLLDARLRRSASASGAELFSEMWSFFHRFYFMFKIREYYFNPFRTPIENSVLCKILYVVRGRFPDYRPEIRILNSELIERMLEPDRRIVVVSIHNALSTAMVQILQSRGRPCSLVSISADSAELLDILGSKEAYRLIYPDENVLLKARRDLNEGRAVCCHPDTVTRRLLNIFNRFYIEKGIFEFAGMANAQVFYALAQVSESGTIVLQVGEPKYPAGSRSAAEMAEDFIAFLHATLKDGRQWSTRA